MCHLLYLLPFDFPYAHLQRGLLRFSLLFGTESRVKARSYRNASGIGVFLQTLKSNAKKVFLPPTQELNSLFQQ